MTETARMTFTDAIAHAAEHQQMQMWRAAQTVRSHVAKPQDRADILECLGLSDAVQPDSR